VHFETKRFSGMNVATWLSRPALPLTINSDSKCTHKNNWPVGPLGLYPRPWRFRRSANWLKMSEAELHLVNQIPKGIQVPDLTSGQPTEGMPVQL